MIDAGNFEALVSGEVDFDQAPGFVVLKDKALGGQDRADFRRRGHGERKEYMRRRRRRRRAGAKKD